MNKLYQLLSSIYMYNFIKNNEVKISVRRILNIYLCAIIALNLDVFSHIDFP